MIETKSDKNCAKCGGKGILKEWVFEPYPKIKMTLCDCDEGKES